MSDNSKIDIDALLSAIEPDPVKQKVILMRMIQAAAREAFPVKPDDVAPRFTGGLPPDHSFGSGLPPSVLKEMAAAVPTDMLNDIVREQRAGVPQPSMAIEPRSVSAVRGPVSHGFRERGK